MCLIQMINEFLAIDRKKKESFKHDKMVSLTAKLYSSEKSTHSAHFLGLTFNTENIGANFDVHIPLYAMVFV